MVVAWGLVGEEPGNLAFAEGGCHENQGAAHE